LETHPRYEPRYHYANTRATVARVHSYLIKDEVMKCEILWIICKIMYHISNRTAGSMTDMFKVMFSDSLIAQKLHLHKDKVGYMFTFGIGPYFQTELSKYLQTLDFYTLSFDESLNKVTQKSQMDFIVRYWDNALNIVQCRYLTSMFLEGMTASHLLDAYTVTLSDLGLSMHHVIQIATDGPNVNLKFHNNLHELCEKSADPEKPIPLNTGTCLLHVVHNAYKNSIKECKWDDVIVFLKLSYYLFKDFPSRRASFVKETKSPVFPLKFCSVR
jgi:hypothetical protein